METTSGGVRIHFEVYGAGEPVLLVHGFPLSGRLWEEVVQRLAGEFRLIVPDLRGHGRSEASDAAEMATYAADLVSVLDAADEIRPVVAVGMSMGGYVCLELCRREPQRVRALALVDSRAEPDSPEGAEGRLALAERVLRAGSGFVADDMTEKLWGAAAGEPARSRWREEMAKTDPRGVAAAARAMAARPDSRPLLRAKRFPLLVVVGEEDRITPPDGARALAEEVGATLETVPAAGHMAAAERPDEVAEALGRFIRALPREAPAVERGRVVE